MIPVEIRMALWDLMDSIEKVDGLTVEDKEAVAAMLEACNRLSDYIIAQNRGTKMEVEKNEDYT